MLHCLHRRVPNGKQACEAVGRQPFSAEGVSQIGNYRHFVVPARFLRVLWAQKNSSFIFWPVQTQWITQIVFPVLGKCKMIGNSLGGRRRPGWFNGKFQRCAGRCTEIYWPTKRGQRENLFSHCRARKAERVNTPAACGGSLRPQGAGAGLAPRYDTNHLAFRT